MISVPLLGTYGLSTLMKFGLFGAWFTILWLTMTKWKFSLLTKIILCVAQVYYVFWLVHFPNNAYTNDLPEHIAYLQHLAFNWKDLFGYGGYERFHPVTYYFLAGLIYKGALLFSQIDPLSGVRIFSIFLYTIFILFAIRTLRECINTRSLTYIVGVVLIVFWPVSILMATRISNDVLLYAFWGAAYFYLIRWTHTRSKKNLSITLALLGLAIMVKSNAVVLGALIGACVINSYRENRIKWNDIGWPPLAIGGVALALGLTVNMSRIIFEHAMNGNPLTTDHHFGYLGQYHPGISHYFTINFKEYFEWPFIRWPAERSDMPFLNYFLRTTLFGEFSFVNVGMGAVLEGMVLVYAGTVSTFCLIFSWRHWRSLAPHVMTVGICLLFLQMFMFFRNWGVCQDFRFVLPMIVPTSILYVKGLEYLHIQRWFPLYWGGIILGFSLPSLGVLFYLLQYIPNAVT